MFTWYEWLRVVASSSVGRGRTLKSLKSLPSSVGLGRGRTFKSLPVNEVLLTGLGQRGVRQRRDEARLAEVRPHIATQNGAEEAPQRHDVTERRRPRRQEVLEHVMKSVRARQHGRRHRATSLHRSS